MRELNLPPSARCTDDEFIRRAFLDTLGIGNFATTTSLFRFGRMVPDELIPGTLNAGHTLPVITEAFIYIAIIADMVLKPFSA